MTVYEKIAARVTALDAAERYGLHIYRNGRALCPWHDDHKPDLSFHDGRCHCFACGRGGDAVALTARLHGTSNAEAARMINTDFNLGLNIERPNRKRGKINRANIQKQNKNAQRERWIILCEAVQAVNNELQNMGADPDTAWDDPAFIAALELRALGDIHLYNQQEGAKR